MVSLVPMLVTVYHSHRHRRSLIQWQSFAHRVTRRNLWRWFRDDARDATKTSQWGFLWRFLIFRDDCSSSQYTRSFVVDRWLYKPIAMQWHVLLILKYINYVSHVWRFFCSTDHFFLGRNPWHMLELCSYVYIGRMSAGSRAKSSLGPPQRQSTRERQLNSPSFHGDRIGGARTSTIKETNEPTRTVHSKSKCD